MGIPWDRMGWDRHELLWNGMGQKNSNTEKFVPWTRLIIVPCKRLKNACFERGWCQLCTEFSSLKGLISVQFYAALR